MKFLRRNMKTSVIIDENGFGLFHVKDGSVSVYIPKKEVVI